MIAQHLSRLNSSHIVLASASPRRRALLLQMGLSNVEVEPSQFAEDLDHADFSGPEAYVMRYAAEKADEVNARLGQRPDLVVGSDTVIAVDGEIWEKPADAVDAVRMLTALRGRQHEVWSGVAIVQNRALDGKILPGGRTAFAERTIVNFANLEHAAILAYVESGEPMDKAGSYGIQGPGGTFVQSINGCYNNVVGFPLTRFAAELGALLAECDDTTIE